MSNQSNPKAGLGALLTPNNCVLLIDHQPFQFAGLRSHDTQTIINNVVWAGQIREGLRCAEINLCAWRFSDE